MNNDPRILLVNSMTDVVRDFIAIAAARIQAGEPIRRHRASTSTIGEHCVNKKREKRNTRKKAQKASRRANRS